MSIRRIPAIALLALACAVGTLMAGCGTDAKSTSATTSETSSELLPITDVVDLRGKPEVTVEVTDNVYTPRVIQVDPGTKVIWQNKGGNAHNVTPVGGETPSVPSGKLDPKMSADVTFSAAGTYRYYCSIHGTPQRGQRGAVVVGELPPS